MDQPVSMARFSELLTSRRKERGVWGGGRKGEIYSERTKGGKTATALSKKNIGGGD